MIQNTVAGNKLIGFYRGIVKKHCLNGRCKVFIPGVYPESMANSPDDLPDAQQAVSLFCTSDAENGMFAYPEIDSIVWCFFENNDINFPIFFAATHEFGSHCGVEKNYDKIKSSSGAKTKIIKVDNVEITIKEGDTSIEVKNGNAKFALEENGTVRISGSTLVLDFTTIRSTSHAGTTITSNADLKINSPQSIELVSSRIQLKETGGGILLAGDMPWEHMRIM